MMIIISNQTPIDVTVCHLSYLFHKILKQKLVKESYVLDFLTNTKQRPIVTPNSERQDVFGELVLPPNIIHGHINNKMFKFHRLISWLQIGK